MSKNAIDRRAPRARALLQQALMSLIDTKRYEAITVNDICEAAKVGRSTFYSHYRSKDDLKRSGVESMGRSLLARQRAVRAHASDPDLRKLGFSLSVFEHARDHLDHYRALAGDRGRTVVLTKIRQMLCDLVRDELAVTVNNNSKERIPNELVVQYVVGAYMAVMTWWLDSGATLPPQRIDAMFRHLAIEGVIPSQSNRIDATSIPFDQ